ncbi:hypothetical protein DOM22_14635 [Bdellovibrio sp. ZAP7]|uniref:hypothetical protein n=1 Tax=Bdellovibrio sp. ZAP7 TaxID=2231053 RepID=UPI00115B79C6|nr:hypothetical protein [Bdellovibrio sp. ZAP7]QDK46313.1 hypothetical protein DOM22_14635 [Bdellovibrio sp. ZAP7]
MKVVLSLFAFFAASSALAETVVCKQLDAKVVAEIVDIKPLEGTGLCEAELSFEGSKALYLENNSCALPYDEVIARKVALKCEHKPGDELIGLLYRSVFDVQIYFYKP